MTEPTRPVLGAGGWSAAVDAVAGLPPGRLVVVAGSRGVAGASPAVPFRGWSDLMSAINSLPAGADKTEHDRETASGL